MRLTRNSKYSNVRTTVGDIKFASKAEARRYGELRLLEKAGQIRGLRLQPRFPLFVGEHLICTYVGDFQYEEEPFGPSNDPAGKLVVEDVKGFKTDVYRIKRELLFATQGIAIREVK